MYSTPTFPSGTHPFELTVAVGKWGETFATSHAQLSLVGWGTNQQWDESALGAWGSPLPMTLTRHCEGRWLMMFAHF